MVASGPPPGSIKTGSTVALLLPLNPDIPVRVSFLLPHSSNLRRKHYLDDEIYQEKSSTSANFAEILDPVETVETIEKIKGALGESANCEICNPLVFTNRRVSAFHKRHRSLSSMNSHFIANKRKKAKYVRV